MSDPKEKKRRAKQYELVSISKSTLQDLLADSGELQMLKEKISKADGIQAAFLWKDET